MASWSVEKRHDERSGRYWEFMMRPSNECCADSQINSELITNQEGAHSPPEQVRLTREKPIPDVENEKSRNVP